MMQDPTTPHDPQQTTGHDDTAFVMETKELIAGRYRLLELLGEGGMGQVWKATDTVMNRDVALKFIKHESVTEKMIRRFEEESRITAQLQHPGIVPIHDFGFLGEDLQFFTMRIVKGNTFGELLRQSERQLDDITKFVQILLDVSQVMAYAHSRKVIHRDLKPENIMVGAFGEVQVMDWGLAKVLGVNAVSVVETDESTVISSPRDSDLTQAGSVMGTWPYMAPEQARGQIDMINARADVFSLGSILCEILTGKPVYHGEGIRRQAGEADLDDAFARLEKCDADPALIAIACKCLSEKASQRYANAVELAQALEEHLQSVQSRLQEERIAKEKQAVQLVEEKRRRRWQMGVALAVLLLLIGSAGGGFYAYQQSEKERFRVQAEAEELRQKKTLQRELAEVALADGEKFLREVDDSAAETALGRAEEILRHGGAEDQLARLKQLQRMMAFAKRLEEIRMNAATWISTEGGGSFDYVSALRDYPIAFQSEGYDVLTGDVGEVAKRIRQLVIIDRLVASLDAWTQMADLQRELSVRNRVMSLAQQVDANPRNRELKQELRDPNKWSNRERFIELARDVDATRFSPELILLLQQRLPIEQRRELLQRGIMIHPTDFWLHFTLGNVFDKNDSTLRIGSFRCALAIRPEATAAWNNLGNALGDSGDLPGAIASCKKALEIDPKRADAHYNLGNALHVSDDLLGAIAAYKQAIKLDPKNANAHSNLGAALGDSGDLHGAIAAYKQAIKLDPKNAITHYNLGAALDDFDDLPGAIAAYKQAIEIDPKRADAHNNLGLVLRKSGDLLGAIAAYNQAIKLDPKLAVAHYNLGCVLRESSDQRGAITAYKQAIELDPKNAVGHYILGLVLDESGDLPGAIAAFKKAIKFNPKNANAHYSLGLALHNSGDLLAAIAAYKQAIEIDPKNSFAHNNLGFALSESGDLPGAIAVHKQAIKIDPKNAKAHNNLGLALRKSGDLAGAIVACKQAIKLDNKDAIAHVNLGLALQALGHFANAKEALEKAVQLAGNNKSLKQFAEAHIQQCNRFMELEEQLSLLAAGKVQIKNATLAIELADFLIQIKRQPLLAVSFYQQAFALDPRLSNRVNSHQYHAALAALLSANLLPQWDALALGYSASLRNQAHAWLSADLQSLQQQPDAKILQHWKTDPDLASIRDPKALAQLSIEERKRWQQLWADVDALLK